MRRSSSSLTFRLALVALLLATALSFAEGVDGWRTRLTAYKSAIERGEEGIWSKMLSDIDFGVNLYAVENLPSEEVTKHRDVLLGFALKSGFKPLRTAAARKLSGESGELLYEKSKQAVESGGKEAKNALDALGILGTESARTYITELITSSRDFEISQYTFRVLVRRPDESGFRALSSIAGSAEYGPALRIQAIGALSRFHIKANVEFLIGLLKVEDADVLDAVWLSLQSLTGKKFLPEASYWNSWWSRVKDGYEFPAADALPEHESVTVGEEELNEAVLLGCDWLLEHQSQDGHFDALDYSAHEGYVADRGRNDTNVCMTALSVMSLLSAGDRGSSAQRAAREGAMARAMNWLVTVPNEGGNYRSDNPVTYVHEQGAAAWVLAEYVAAGHEEYIPYLQQAIEKSMEYRDGDRVWGYPGMVGNTSNSCVTVWYACAFAAARNAGIDLPREGWAAISAWFDYATIEHSGYVFNANIKEPSEAMTGVGLLCKRFSLFDMSAPVHKRSTSLLMKRDVNRISYYDMYCYALGLARTEYEPARHYVRKIQRYLIDTQVKEGEGVRGSWAAPHDIWETSRLYTAGMAIPCLTAFDGELAILRDY